MRIASLAPSNTEILYALGLGEAVVATTAYCDHPEAVGDTATLGGWINPQLDRVRSVDPDVIVTSSFLQDSIRYVLRDEYEVVHVDPSCLDDIYRSIKVIAERFNCEDRGEAIVHAMRSELQSVQVQQPTPTPVIYCEEWHKPPHAAGNWVPELIRIAGGEPACGVSGEPSEEVSYDDVCAADPDGIVLHWCGFSGASDEERILDRDGWSGLLAVEEGHVYTVDDALLNRPGPRVVKGCKALQSIITACT